MDILINHIGYPKKGPKQALLQGLRSSDPVTFYIHQIPGDKVFTGQALPSESPDGWPQGVAQIDFSALELEGTFCIECHNQYSSPFQIQKDPYSADLISDLIFYFKGQRNSGPYERADRKAPFCGGLRRDTKDLRGGWFDAAGDVSKYLSHLSYANFLNPQQSPLIVWTLLESEALISHCHGDVYLGLKKRLLDEALHGADFLVRMMDEKGFFYQTLFDKWSKDPAQREICAYKTQAGIKEECWEASFRSGGGMAIAALARAARRHERGDYAPEIYAEKALEAYDHLRNYNRNYLPDGEENVIDDYTALLAAVELYKLTGDDHFRKDSSIWAHSLQAKQRTDDQFSGWLAVREDLDRPYYHASDSGLPWIALAAYIQIEKDPTERSKALAALEQGIAFELSITQIDENPFGYARQYVQGVQSPKRSSYFIPHDNESGYWWQGENARLASLATAALRCGALIPDFAPDLRVYAQNQINWILGLNPFDSCQMHRQGRNNPRYEEAFPNAPGGVCNGITSRWTDDQGIQFGPIGPDQDRMDQRWRWGEQWTPHAAHFCLALAQMASLSQEHT